MPSFTAALHTIKFFHLTQTQIYQSTPLFHILWESNSSPLEHTIDLLERTFVFPFLPEPESQLNLKKKNGTPESVFRPQCHIKGHISRLQMLVWSLGDVMIFYATSPIKVAGQMSHLLLL